MWAMGELRRKLRLMGLKGGLLIYIRQMESQVRVSRPTRGVRVKGYSYPADRGPSASNGQVGHQQD